MFILSSYYIVSGWMDGQTDRLTERCLSLWTTISLLIIPIRRQIYPPSNATQYFLNIQRLSDSNTLKKEIISCNWRELIFMYMYSSKALLSSLLHTPNENKNYFYTNMLFKHLECSQCMTGRISNSSPNEWH